MEEIYSVFFKDGDEATDRYLSRKDALSLAEKLKNEGYEVIVSKLVKDNWKPLSDVKVGDTLRIISLYDVQGFRYHNKIGVVEHIDDLGQLHGTWGGIAVLPEEDEFTIIKRK